MKAKNLSKVVKTILISGMLNLNLIAITQEESKTEALKLGQSTQEEFKTGALKLGQPAFFFTTHAPDPYINLLKADVDEAKIIKCGCIDPKTGNARHVKETEDLQNICALELTVNGFGGNYKHKMKYYGERKSIIGKLLEVVSEEAYPGTIFIDEYKEGIPMFWVLKNVEELRAIFTYMAKKFEAEEFTPKQKNLLVLKLQNDPTFETLSVDEKNFLNTYFEVFSLTDKDVKQFFEAAKRLMLDMNHNIGSSNPKYVGETILQSVLRQTEKFYKDFEAKHIIPIIGIGFTVLVVSKLLEDEIKEIKESIQGGIEKLTGAKTVTGATKNLFSKMFSD